MDYRRVSIVAFGSYFAWRLIFFINPPLLALCYVLGVRAIKETKDSRVRHIDLKGAVLAMMALAGITYGLIEGPPSHWGWASITSLMSGIVLSAVFLRVERRSPDPMLALSLFRSHNFTGANIVTFAMYGALGGFFFALLIYLQSNVGFSSFEAGMSMLPVTLLLLALSSRIGKLASAYGPRLFMTIGPILAGLGILALLPLGEGATYVRNVLPGITLFGLGLAITVAPLTTTVLNSVATDQSGIASAVNNAVSRVSGLTVIAALGLFGAAHAYQFAVILSATLAILAGLLALVLIVNPSLPKRAIHNS